MFQLLGLYMGSLILRSIGIALFAGLCSWKIRNVAIRHAVWVAVLGAMLLMPAVDYLLPPAWVPARIRHIAAEQPTAFRIASAKSAEAPLTLLPEKSSPARPKPVDWWQVAALLYVVVAGAMSIRLTLAFRKLLKLRRVCKAVSSSVWDELRASQRAWWRIPVLMESESVRVPMTIGYLRPAVILPIEWRSWDEAKLQVVLLHEMAHIRRGDWGIALVAAVAKCAYWLNPLSWFLERKLALLAELACDDATLSATQDLTYYAEILLEFASAAQNSGRLMKGGVAMAHRRIQERIERVLGMPHMGSGIVNVAGWIVVLMAATPVIYSAAALQVRSEPAKVSAATYAAEFGRNPAAQLPAAVPQALRPTVPGAAPQAQQNSSDSVVDPRAAYKQMEIIKQQLQQASQMSAESFQMVQKYNSSSQGPIQDPQIRPDNLTTPDLLREELRKAEKQLITVQAAIRQQNQDSPPPSTSLDPSKDALLDLPDKEDDLLTYLKQLVRLRNAPIRNLFLVTFAGIQGRSISMKVAEQNFTFGCESCSFFVGESVVSSAAPAPTTPGIIVRLSPDGSELTVGCRATLCNINFEGGNTGQQTMWQFAFGDSETFAASKLRSVVVSKD